MIFFSWQEERSSSEITDYKVLILTASTQAWTKSAAVCIYAYSQRKKVRNCS